MIFLTQLLLKLCWFVILFPIFLTTGCMSTTVPRLTHFSRAPGSFYNFFRLDEILFNLLVNKVTPLIKRKTTRFRTPVSPRDRVAVTLRYLATGNSMTDLHYTFRFGEYNVYMSIIR